MFQKLLKQINFNSVYFLYVNEHFFWAFFRIVKTLAWILPTICGSCSQELRLGEQECIEELKEFCSLNISSCGVTPILNEGT